jgi:hypothetical protein
MRFRRRFGRCASVAALLGSALFAACGDPSDLDTSPRPGASSAGTGGGAGRSGNVAFGGSAAVSSSGASGASGVAGGGGLAGSAGSGGQGIAGAAGGFGGLAGVSGGAGVGGAVNAGAGSGGASAGGGGTAATDPVPDAKFDAAWVVFKARCSMCHGDAAEKFGGSDRQAAFTAALIYKAEISQRISLSRSSFGAMPPSGPLPESELTVVKAWLASVP